MNPTTGGNRSAVLTGWGLPYEVREVSVPDPEPGALIVEIEAATMCGTDAHMHAGDFAEGGYARLPVVPGHEMVGRVVAIGAKARRDVLGREVRIGDRIAWAYAWCGECYWCAIAKQPTLCEFARMYGWGPADEFPYATGAFAQFAYVLPNCKIVTVPEELSGPVAASATCAFRTVVHGMERAGGVRTSDTVVIQGSGAVGLYALAYALGSGARQVIVIGAPTSRLRVAEKWGAAEIIDLEKTDQESRVERVKELTGGRGADLVIECAGSRFALEEGLKLARRGAQYLVIGATDPVPASIPGLAINQRQIALIGPSSADASHYYRALRFAADHADRFSWADLLGHTYGLEQLTDAVDAIASGRELRPIIRAVP